ncbi:MAG: 50S ribosomal protein L14 [Candidatus Bathyarchaeota archaeon]
MPGVKTRAVSAKGIVEYRPKVSRALPTGAIVGCADNTGGKKLRIIQVIGYKGRLRRIPSAKVGDMLLVSVRKGAPDLRKQILPAVLIRQRMPFRRMDGTVIQFEDNAAVLMTPEGELKGTEIKGPVTKEAAERWPRIASISSMII